MTGEAEVLVLPIMDAPDDQSKISQPSASVNVTLTLSVQDMNKVGTTLLLKVIQKGMLYLRNAN